MRKLWISFICFICLLTLQTNVLLAASGLASSVRHDVEITVDKVKENITCIQDAKDKNQWYYLPNRPRLVENQKKEPTFMMVKYQESDRSGIAESGGLIQAAFSLSLPPKGLEQLAKELGKVLKVNHKTLKIAPLDIKSSLISVYSLNGEQMGSEETKPALGPTLTNAAIPLQMRLHKDGAPVAEALLEGTGGIQVLFNLEYDALTPECSIKVTADWDQMHDHFSTNTKAVVSYSGLFYSGSAQTNIQTARNTLEQNKCIKIETIGGAALSDEEITKTIEPIIEQLNKKFFDMKAPDKISSAKADDAKPGSGKKFTGGVSFALKTEKERLKGTYTFDLRKRHIVTKSTTVGGVIGLSDYSEAIRNKAIVTVDPTYWKSAFYRMPPVSSALKDVDQITLTVNIQYDGTQADGTEQQLAFWTAREGWRDINNVPIIYFNFPLMSTYDKYSKKDKNFKKKLVFEQNFAINYLVNNRTKEKKAGNTLPVFNGDVPLSNPMVNFTYVAIEANPDDIAWSRDDYTIPEYEDLVSDLSKVEVKLSTDKPKNTGEATLNTRTDFVSFWFDHDKDGNLPLIDATYTFHSRKVAKALNTPDKKTIVITSKIDAINGNNFINLMDDDYLPIERPEGFK